MVLLATKEIRQMSIVTKTGDTGNTALMYGRRVPKSDPRIEACGAVDELNAVIGLARANAVDESWRGELRAIQKDLVTVMGELATVVEDQERYSRDGFAPLSADRTLRLEETIGKLEAALPIPRDWAIPGGNLRSATLDFARAVCRRAERRVCVLQGGGQLQNSEILVYLNRLSDLLWLLARNEDTKGNQASA